MEAIVRRLPGILAALATIVMLAPLPAAAQSRIALVVGNGAYARGAVTTSLADAGLVAEALNSIGFEIVEGADFDQAELRRTFRDFLARVEAAGPDAIAFVYLSGYGVEFEGENYLLPVDARLTRDTDIPLEAVRISDLVRPLAGAAARAKLFVLDASRPLPFTIEVAPGLAATEASPGMLIAYSAAPGTFAQDTGAAYGAYANAMAEMLREGGLDLDTIFTQTRVRTHELTEGRQTPWHVEGLTEPIVLVPGDGQPAMRAPRMAAPQGIAGAVPRVVLRQPRPMREVDPEEAYGLAVEMDTLPGYVEYVETYPDSPYAPRFWAVIRVRREALAWMRACEINTPAAYWTYMQRYPDGIYVPDARRSLRRLAALTMPPPGFAPIELMGVPPPLSREPREYIGVYAPVRLPGNLIAPRPAYFSSLPPPPPPRGPRLLPAPAGLPLIPRLSEPPKRYGPPVGVMTPGTGQPVIDPSGRKFGTPPGQPGFPPPDPGQRKFGTGTPPGAVQPGGAPPVRGPIGGDPRRFGTPGMPMATPPGPPGGDTKRFGTPGVPMAPPPQPAGPPPAARIVPPPPQQQFLQGGGPVGAPALRAGPPPQPAAVARPVPPVVQRPAAPVVRPAGPPPGRKCPIVNGVERC